MRPAELASDGRRRRSRVPGTHVAAHAVALTGLGAWAAISVLSQHPYRLFDAVSRGCGLGPLVPDWRFFAPEPARHDNHLLVRVRDRDGVVSPWRVVHEFKRRSGWQLLWFPTHRHEKAVFDVCSGLQQKMMESGEDITTSQPYALLRGFVAHAVRSRFPGDLAPQGFQFVLLRAAGHDVTEDLDYQMVSPFIPLVAVAATS